MDYPNHMAYQARLAACHRPITAREHYDAALRALDYEATGTAAWYLDECLSLLAGRQDAEAEEMREGVRRMRAMLPDTL